MDNKFLLDFSVRTKILEDDIYVVKKTQAWKVNETMNDIILLCTGEHTLQEISEIIAASYNIDLGTATKDCQEVIDFCTEQKIIRPV